MFATSSADVSQIKSQWITCAMPNINCTLVSKHMARHAVHSTRRRHRQAQPYHCGTYVPQTYTNVNAKLSCTSRSNSFNTIMDVITLRSESKSSKRSNRRCWVASMSGVQVTQWSVCAENNLLYLYALRDKWPCTLCDVEWLHECDDSWNKLLNAHASVRDELGTLFGCNKGC